VKTFQVFFAACLLGLLGLAIVPNVAWSASRAECYNAAHVKYGNPNMGANRAVLRHAVRRCLKHGLDAI
jgi:hypothetical protein